MRPVSRLWSVLLALVLVAASLLTVSAHDSTTHTTETNPKYGARVILTRTDSKDPVHPGTLLTFDVYVQRGEEHDIPSAATLTSAGSTTETLGVDLVVGGRQAITKEIEYTVQPSDLGGGIRRTAPITFTLTFTPTEDRGVAFNDVHAEAVVVSAQHPVIVTKKSEASSGDGSAELTILWSVEEPDVIAEGENVEFTVSAVTRKYALVTKPLLIRKRLYDETGKRIGPTTHARTVIIRYLDTNAVSPDFTATYVLTEADADAATIEFFYELTVEDTDLRTAAGTSSDLDEDYEETFRGSYIIGRRLVSATPTPIPTPATKVVGTTSEVTVTDEGDFVRVNRHDGGQDFLLSLGYLAPNGGRGFNRLGYIRDGDPSRGGQTYAVVRRESDQVVVRMWISPESPERHEVPWNTVTRPPYTVPVSILGVIPLDETRPVENQLARRFDANTDGRIYVYRQGAWHWIPDIPTFEAEGFYWCDVTAADPGFFRRANIGSALPRSGTAANPNYPNCHSK